MATPVSGGRVRSSVAGNLGAGMLQGRFRTKPPARRQRPRRVHVTHVRLRLPRRGRREPENEAIDDSVAIGEREVVVEPVSVGLCHENGRQCVAELVAHDGVGKRRIGTPPLRHRSVVGVDPRIVVDVGESWNPRSVSATPPLPPR